MLIPSPNGWVLLSQDMAQEARAAGDGKAGGEAKEARMRPTQLLLSSRWLPICVCVSRLLP